ncbi:MAG: hypothetical protein A2V93_12015 [Ignavibacteria bacterium RBG_16_34_14]|nr:MAG: hypothetical protein A2V93_12015 [Ignavibacteria bacterium RBG_16_34_14]
MCAIKMLFPKEMECPHCKSEVELSDEERSVGKFICPDCQKEVDAQRITDSIKEASQQVSNNKGSSAGRAGCLTAFLIAMFVLNPLIGLYYVSSSWQVYDTFLRRFDDSTAIIVFLLLVICPFMNVIFAIQVWHWKKFGLKGFWVTSIILLFVNLSVGLSAILSIIGLAGPIILTVLMNKQSEKFR